MSKLYTDQVNTHLLSLYANYRKLHMLQSDLMVCFIHITLINSHPYTSDVIFKEKYRYFYLGSNQIKMLI